MRWGKIINTGSLFAIGIAWLGLLGLMRLSLQKRTKEIGIRKVLGASTSGIIMLLSKRYLLLVLLGNLIAWPVGWWLSSQWLESLYLSYILKSSLVFGCRFWGITTYFDFHWFAVIKCSAAQPGKGPAV